MTFGCFLLFYKQNACELMKHVKEFYYSQITTTTFVDLGFRRLVMLSLSLYYNMLSEHI